MSPIDGSYSEAVVTATLKAHEYVLWEHEDEYQSGDTVYLAPENGLVFSDTKGKTSSTYTYTKQSEDHGIDKVQYDRYVAIAERMHLPGTIVIYEEQREVDIKEFVDSDTVLIFRLEDIYRTNTTTADYGKGGMVYWRRTDAWREYSALRPTPDKEKLR